jgi:hypothetical protein
MKSWILGLGFATSMAAGVLLGACGDDAESCDPNTYQSACVDEANVKNCNLGTSEVTTVNCATALKEALGSDPMMPVCCKISADPGNLQYACQDKGGANACE